MKNRFCVGIVLAVFVSRPALADMPVIDVSALARWTQQLQQMAYQLQTLQQQYLVAVQQFQSLNHLTSFGTILPQLQTPMLANPLPGASNIAGLLNGSGAAGPLSGMFSSNLSANTIYTPTGSGWEAQHIIQDGRSIAGAQTISQQLYDSASQRIPYMQSLVQQLNVTTDPAQREGLMTRIQGEQAIINTQEVQAQTMGTWYSAQTQLMQQQAQERSQQEVDQELSEAKANGIDVGQ